MEQVSLFSVTLASILATAGQSTSDIQQQAAVSTYVLPEIAGLWELDLPDSFTTDLLTADTPAYDDDTSVTVVAQNVTCRERYNFSKDNVLLTVSGLEWTHGKYVYRHQTDGFPVLMIKTEYDNNAADCFGNQVDQTGESLVTYVDYQPSSETMSWCADGDGHHCFATLHRLLP